MSLLDKKLIIDKILKLKFEKQTQEIKRQIQKLQQELDNIGDGFNK